MAKLKSGTRIYGTAGIDTSLTVGSGVTITSTSISATNINIAGIATVANDLNVTSGRVGVGTNIYPNGEKLVVDSVNGNSTYNTKFVFSGTTNTAYCASTWTHGQSGTAIGYVGVGGSNTGNPSFRNTFVVGTQNANDLVLNTGDIERLRIDSSGRVTSPNQPVFSAYRTGNQTGLNCTLGNTSVVVYNTTNVNIGNCYSTTTGLFTAPVAGRYIFSLSANTSITIEEMWWIINGGRNVTPQNSPASVTPKGQDVFYLNAGDTIGAHLYDVGGDTNVTVIENSYHTFFKGCLIC